MNCCDYTCDQGRNCPARSLNTRRFPRTLNEAFPGSPEYAASVERPIDKEDRLVLRASVVVACVLALVLTFGG
jgi:hypothetical protein